MFFSGKSRKIDLSGSSGQRGNEGNFGEKLCLFAEVFCFDAKPKPDLLASLAADRQRRHDERVRINLLWPFFVRLTPSPEPGTH